MSNDIFSLVWIGEYYSLFKNSLSCYSVSMICECLPPCSPDMVGTGCEHDGVIYRNGQSFKPNCKYQCVCVNGAIGCVALCNESQPPRVWCQTPRRVKLPGRCCEEWICDEARRGRKTNPRHAVEGRMWGQTGSWNINSLTHDISTYTQSYSGDFG